MIPKSKKTRPLDPLQTLDGRKVARAFGRGRACSCRHPARRRHRSAPAGEWRIATRSLAAWDIALGLYLVLAFRLMTNCDINRIKRRAALQDEGRITICGAWWRPRWQAYCHPGRTGRRQSPPAHLALAAVTILLSWSFTHTIFAIHYAHEYYGENSHKGSGLNFPGEAPPDYWDFVYFSSWSA